MNSDKSGSEKFLTLSLLLGLTAAIAMLIFFGWLADEALEGETRHFDEATRAAVHQLASPLLTTIMRGVSFLGSTLALAIGTTIIVVRFAMLKWGREAKLFAITMIGAGLLNITYSFPSGHSLTSAVFFGALAAMLTTRVKSRRVRVIVWVVCTLMFVLIGFSRIYLGVHHTTDVIAGFAAALIWILVVRFVEMQLARRKRRRNQSV
jgi:undecaprenyl-diphosphatase